MAQLTAYASIDNWMDGVTKGDNHGTDNPLRLGEYFIGEVKTTLGRPILNFDVTPLVGLYTSIDSALLQVFTSARITAAAGTVDRCTRPSTWTEGGCTWDDYDGTNPWTVAGGDISTPSVAITTPTGANGLKQYTGMVGFVTDAIASRSNIISIIMRLDDENTGSSQGGNFYSSEAGSSPYWPQFIITYTPIGGDRRRFGMVP